MTPISSKPRSALFVLSKRLDSQVQWTPTEVAIAWALASFMRYDVSRNRYVCWPSMATIARKSRHCDRAVRKTIKDHLKRPPSERLFTFDGSINVHKPKGLRRWALVEHPDGYAAAHDRHQVPINSVRRPAPSSAPPAPGSDHPAFSSVTPAPDADELQRTDHELKKNTALPRGADARASVVPFVSDVAWVNDCRQVHLDEECATEARHCYRLRLDASKRQSASLKGVTTAQAAHVEGRISNG